MPEVITDNLDLWTSALLTKSTAGRGSNGKLEAYGIKKLRELILELAVRGKLVPQEANDEPASTLLGKIVHEKARLNIEGRVRKHEKPPAISDSEKPFHIPAGWDWARLGDVVEVVRGITFPASEKSRVAEEGRVACLRTTNVQDRIEWDDMLYVRREFVTRDEQFVRISDIVMSTANSRELVGKVAIVEEEPEYQTAFGGFLTVLRPILLDPSFVMVLLRTPVSRNALIDSASQTTNIANISIGKLNPLVMAIPPLAEQHRIVAKVDELMALCDQLEQQQTHSLEAHQTLVASLLGTLTRVEPQQEFSTAWARIANHFDTLFTTEASIDQLKQTILQLAVMGKLVPQDPNDESANSLLVAIGEEKEKLVEEGVIGRQKQYPKISSEERLFVTPAGWQWVRLDTLFNIIVDCPHSTPKFTDTGILCLDTNSFKQGDLIESKFRYVDADTYLERIARLTPEDGDIVFAREGSVGESVVLPPGLQCCLGQRVMLFRPSKRLNSEYLRLAISAPRSLEALLELHKGIGAKHVNVGDMRAFPIALPPEAEQHRIVAKFDELMALCDTLKARIKDAQAIQLHLADAIVEQAVC